MLTMRLPKLVVALVALSAVLAGCTIVPEPSVTTATTSPSPEATDVQTLTTPTADPTYGRVPDGYVDLGYGTSVPAGYPRDCAGPADIYIGTQDGTTITEVLLPENLVDMGSRTFAEGEVGYDDQGRVATYTVVAGDVEGVIGERLCIYNGEMIGWLNGHKGFEPIQPGEVLVINPDAVPGFEYEDPYG